MTKKGIKWLGHLRRQKTSESFQVENVLCKFKVSRNKNDLQSDTSPNNGEIKLRD